MPDSTAKEQLAEKILLEQKLKPKLKKFFKQVNKDVAIIWANSGVLPDFSFYEEDLVAILRQHYRMVGDKFTTKIREKIFSKYEIPEMELKQDLAEEFEVEDVTEEQSRIEAAVLAALLAFIALHSLEQARIILDTTNRQYDKIIDKVIAEAAENGDTLSREEAATLITEGYNDIIDGRVDSIALTETQAVAERSKFIEGTILIGSALLLAGELVGDVVVKTWNAILDDRTRDHHAAAHGQQVLSDQPFIVKGEQLLHPGDTSLGAGADNIINCRCVAVFSVV